MSNNPSVHSSVLSTTEPTVATGSAFSVDGYADRLMDELFEDVEGLVGGESTTTASPQPTVSALSDRPEPLATVATVPESADLQVPENTENSPDDLAVPELDEMLTEPEPEPPRSWVQSLMVATTGVAIVVLTVAGVALYYKTQGIAPVPSPDAAAPDQASLEFAEYMQRSLDAIHRRADHQAMASGNPASEMPNVAVSGTPGAGEQAGTVLERVYIPVYQPSPTTAPTATTPTQQPSAPSTPPRLSPDTTAAAPTTPHLLVGVLELGDRSAALFDINGQTQRVYVGETIGTSGWTLVSVDNQEAIVRRNGDVRSVYVGQQF
jgi:hypothetical protein